MGPITSSLRTTLKLVKSPKNGLRVENRLIRKYMNTQENTSKLFKEAKSTPCLK
jgi:hypothetical protein